jgi:hypothetical protein
VDWADEHCQRYCSSHETHLKNVQTACCLLPPVSPQDVDWAEHPAAGIFAHSTDSSGRQLLMVRRAGCGLDDYGTVDARQIKRARIEGEWPFQLKTL